MQAIQYTTWADSKLDFIYVCNYNNYTLETQNILWRDNNG